MARTDTPPEPSRSKAGKWLRRGFVFLASLLLLLAALLAVAINSSTLQVRLIEKLLTSVTDRPFYIRGDFELSLGSDISVRAEQIEWANPAWSDTPNMLTIQTFAASVVFDSLLSPPIIIRNASADNATLEFEWSEDGQFNWLLGSSDTSSSPEEKKNPFPLLLDAAELTDVSITVKNPALPSPLLWVINSATHQQDDNNNLVTKADTLLNNRKVALDFEIGPFPELIVAGDVDFSAHIVGPVSIIDVKGNVDDLADLSGTDLKASWKAATIENVLDLLNLPPVTTGKLDLNVQLESDGSNLSGNIAGVAGDFDVDANFVTEDRATLEGLHADVTSKGPSARAAGAIVGVRGLPDAPYELRFKADDTPEGLKISEARATTAGTLVKGSALLPQAPQFVDAEAHLELHGDNLDRFQEMATAIDLPALPFNAKLDLTGNGAGTPDKLTGHVDIGEMTADLTATLIEKNNLEGSTFDLLVKIPKARTLAQCFDIELLQPVALSLTSKAKIGATGIDFSDTQATAGDVLVTASGFLPLHDADAAATAKGTISGPSAAALARFFATTDAVPDLPYTADTSVSYAANKLAINSADITLGSTTVSATGSIAPGSSVPTVKLQVSASGKDLDELLKERILRQSERDSFVASGNVSLSDQGLAIEKLSFKTDVALLSGRLSNGWPKDPDSSTFDLQFTGDNMRDALPAVTRYMPAEVAFSVAAKGELNPDYIDIRTGSAEIGSAKAAVKGKITLQPEISASGVIFSVKGDKLSDLGTIEGWQTRDIPFGVSADITGNANRISIEKLRLVAATSDVTGNAQLDFNEKPRIKLLLKSNKLDIRSFVTEATEQQLTTDQNADSKPADGRLIPDYSVPYARLEEANFEIQLSLANIDTWTYSVRELDITAVLDGGNLELREFSAGMDEANIKGSGTVKPINNDHAVELSLVGSNIPLPWIDKDVPGKNKNSGINIEMDLQSSGPDLRTLASRLNGYAWIAGGQRDVENTAISALYGDFFSELFSLINPFAKKEKYTTLVCERILFEADNGILQTSPVVLIRTDKVNTLAVGTVDLKTEKISFGIQSTPRTGIGISAGDLINPFIRLSGTMANPKIRLDPKGTIIEGGAAYMTMGLSILAKSLYTRWLSPKTTCEEYSQQARTLRKERDPNYQPPD